MHLHLRSTQRCLNAGDLLLDDEIAVIFGNHAPGVRVLLIAGQPLREPIVQYGPFVMNSEQEIYRALGDYREGRLA